MLGLLKSDLYRILNPHRLRGEFIACALALVLIIGGALGFTAFMLSRASTGSGLVTSQDAAELASEFNLALVHPSAFLGSILLDGAILNIVTMLGVVVVACADFRDGFAKTLMQGYGRATYFLEKIVFNAIWAALVLIAACLIAIALSALLSFPLSLDEDPLHLFAWLALTWLGLWTLTLVALAIAVLVRRTGAVNVAIIFIGAGAISGFFNLFAELCRVFSEFKLGASSMYAAAGSFAELLPTNLISKLALGSQVLFEPSTTPGLALPGGFATQALLGFCIVSLLSIAIILARGPKREY